MHSSTDQSWQPCKGTFRVSDQSPAALPTWVTGTWYTQLGMGTYMNNRVIPEPGHKQYLVPGMTSSPVMVVTGYPGGTR